MTDTRLASLLPAIEIAAFERGPDGSFAPVAAPPSWFRSLADTTFPFLGHILEEANAFWRSRALGFREFGPVAETDAAGGEFHYKVIAVTSAEAQYLLFQLDTGIDRTRDTLQKARSQRLNIQQSGRTLTTMAREARDMAGEIRDRVTEKITKSVVKSPDEFLPTLLNRSVDLMRHLDELTKSLQQRS